MQPTDLLQRVTFRATPHRAGRTLVRVPRAAVHELAAGRRALVRVTVGDHSYTTRLAPRGRDVVVPVIAAAAGEEVEVTLELDAGAPVVAVPSDLADALEAAPRALHYFESLPYDRQRGVAATVEAAPTPEIRRRRIGLAVARLQAR
jgi:Bacteriocin-protection, YdeI or OmpD-Associated/Domain of unknown function (DUF1905)